MEQYDVFAVGSANKDIYIPVVSSPKEYTHVRREGLRIAMGGGALNVVGFLAHLGLSTAIAGSIGNDANDIILERLKEYGIKSFLIKYEVDTDVTAALHYPDVGKRYISSIKSKELYSPEDLKEVLSEIKKSKVLYRSSYPWQRGIIGKPSIELFDYARKNNVITVFDMSSPERWEEGLLEELRTEIIPRTDWLCANTRELYVLTKEEDKPEIPKSEIEDYMTLKRILKSARMMMDKGVKIVNIHEGRRGSVIIKKGAHYHAEPPRVEKYLHPTRLIPTGTGDAQNSGFIYCMLNEKDLKYTVNFANTMAVLRLSGIRRPKLNQVENFMEKKEIRVKIKS